MDNELTTLLKGFSIPQHVVAGLEAWAAAGRAVAGAATSVDRYFNAKRVALEAATKGDPT